MNNKMVNICLVTVQIWTELKPRRQSVIFLFGYRRPIILYAAVLY